MSILYKFSQFYLVLFMHGFGIHHWFFPVDVHLKSNCSSCKDKNLAGNHYGYRSVVEFPNTQVIRIKKVESSLFNKVETSGTRESNFHFKRKVDKEPLIEILLFSIQNLTFIQTNRKYERKNSLSGGNRRSPVREEGKS